MGVVACCQNQVQREQFKQYCMVTASPQYKPYFASIQHEEYNLDPELKTQRKQYKHGNWKKGSPQTGKGVIFVPEQFYYQGQIVEGVATGEGKIIWPSKTFYRGSIRDNKAQGLGQLYIGEKNAILKGYWQKGYPRRNEKMDISTQGKHGSIIFIDNFDTGIEEYFKDTLKVLINFGDGVSYEGEIKQINHVYRIEGKGTMTYPDSSYYVGEFAGGKMNGKGFYAWPNLGNWFDGYYKSNIREGKGTYYYSATQFESGEWKGGVLIKDQNYINSTNTPAPQNKTLIKKQLV